MNKRTIFILLGLLLIGFSWYKLRAPRYVAGEKAPDFEAPLMTGETVHFSDLKGKYVLIQFWGSWCGPCRLENRSLRPLYQKYHNRGFEIFSIGVERNSSNWQRAIMQDGLEWRYHTADMLEFDGALPKLFNIHSIPSTILVNPEGLIIGTNLEPVQIDQKLAQLLTN